MFIQGTYKIHRWSTTFKKKKGSNLVWHAFSADYLLGATPITNIRQRKLLECDNQKEQECKVSERTMQVILFFS